MLGSKLFDIPSYVMIIGIRKKKKCQKYLKFCVTGNMQKMQNNVMTVDAARKYKMLLVFYNRQRQKEQIMSWLK